MRELGRHDDARQAYDTALRRSPNRFNRLFGAGRAAELGGDQTAAADYYGRLLANAVDTEHPRDRLQHARRALDTTDQ